MLLQWQTFAYKKESGRTFIILSQQMCETLSPAANLFSLLNLQGKKKRTAEDMWYVSYLSSSALHAAWREEKHRYSPGGIPAYTYSKDLQIPSAVKGRIHF